MPPTLSVAVTGATGLIGRALVRSLETDGHRVVAFSRSARSPEAGSRVETARWRPEEPEQNAAALDGLDAVVHLAGEPVGKRWTPARRRAIRDSRVDGTRALVDALKHCANRPARLLGASAIGFYGPRDDEELDEDAASGEGFLAETCRAWEAETGKASELGIAATSMRIGIVLSPEGGALANMLPPFRFGLGGPIGTGTQWMPWIHLEDVVGAIRHLLGTDAAALAPAYNLTAPQPERNAAFTKALGRVLRRPAFLPAPGFAMKLAFGEMADALLLNGARVVPRKLLESGYRFDHPELEPALARLLA